MKREQLPLSFDAPSRARKPTRSRAATAKQPYAASERGGAQQSRIDFERSVFLAPPSGPGPEQRARFELETRLGAMLARSVVLMITDNTRTMISSQRDAGVMRVRLHHMFLHADDRIVRALARYLRRSDADSSALLGDYIRENDHRIRTVRSEPTIRTEGMHHDLRAMFDALNREYFAGSVAAAVTWGQRAPKRRRRRHGRSIRLGSYCEADRLIRIHPALDQAWVPEFFVSFVLFHEMLHHALPAKVHNGRTRFHSAEFRTRERGHPDYERAVRWEHENVDRLLIVASRS